MFERALLLVTEQVGRISNSFVSGMCPNRVQLSQMSKVYLSHIVLLSGRAFQSYVPWIFEIQSVQLIIWRAQTCVCKYCLFSWWLRLVLILKNHYGFPLWTFLWFNFMLICRQNLLYLIKLAPKSFKTLNFVIIIYYNLPLLMIKFWYYLSFLRDLKIGDLFIYV